MLFVKIANNFSPAGRDGVTLVSMEASLRPVSKFLKTVVTASISVEERMSGDQEVEGEPVLGLLSLTTALLMLGQFL